MSAPAWKATDEQLLALRDDAMAEGKRRAAHAFMKRSRGTERNREIHVTEATLAAMLAIAYEAGALAERFKR